MIQWKKGFGIGQSIILMGFLVFLLIPLFTHMTEKIYLKYVVHIVNEAADIAVMKASMELDAKEYSSGNIKFNRDEMLDTAVMDSIRKNCPQSITIMDCDVSTHTAGESCGMGNTSDYDFAHLLLKVSVKRIHGEDRVEFYIHRDVEITCIRTGL